MYNMYKLNPGDSLVIYPKDSNTYIVIQGLLVINQEFSNGKKFSRYMINNGYFIQKLFKYQKFYNYFYTIDAINMSYILTISGDSKSFNERLISLEGNHCIHSRNMLDIHIHKNTQNKVIHLLLMLSELTGQSSSNYILLNTKISFSTIAIIVGTSRNTVSRIINQLKREKLLMYQNKRFIIYNLAKLLSR
uniref:Global nitrogen transcriptional regulator n=1 Tax=Dermonema virens TaxID=1077399 RepID=A0A1G4NS26_9FLOR|nr:Global nitrogen transcriptional regulator [Dermonema virens]SCW21434.1 Global nitrogen transcriptional regulator [Dermonema virens]